jgi:hypothetical protein
MEHRLFIDSDIFEIFGGIEGPAYSDGSTRSEVDLGEATEGMGGERRAMGLPFQ